MSNLDDFKMNIEKYLFVPFLRIGLKDPILAYKTNTGKSTIQVFQLSGINCLHLSSRVQTFRNLNSLADSHIPLS